MLNHNPKESGGMVLRPETALQYLRQAAALQSSGGGVFPEGLFTSFRKNRFLCYSRPDANFFFTASLLFTGSNLSSYLKAAQSPFYNEWEGMLVGMREKAFGAYPLFRQSHSNGAVTYNFWQRAARKHFPDGNILCRLPHFRLADDIDDTSLAFLTFPHSPSEAAQTKEKLLLHANGVQKQNTLGFTEYRMWPVYGTWFGKKMPVEFDVCALLNLMHFTERYKLPKNEYDAGTYKFLRSVLESEKHLNHPFRASANYADSAILLYHYARFAAEFPQALGIDSGNLIKYQCRAILKNTHNESHKLLTAISLGRLGEVVPKPVIDEAAFLKSFVFFLAPMLSAFEGPLLCRFAGLPLVHIEYVSEAFNLLLLAEAAVYCT